MDEIKGIELQVTNRGPIPIPGDIDKYSISRMEYAPSYVPSEGKTITVYPAKGTQRQVGDLEIAKTNLKHGLECLGDYAILTIRDFRGDALIIMNGKIASLRLWDVQARYIHISGDINELCLGRVEAQCFEVTGNGIGHVNDDTGGIPPTLGRPIDPCLRVSHLVRTTSSAFAQFARLLCPTTPIAFTGDLGKLVPNTSPNK